MSQGIYKRKRTDGVAYEVRWREGGKQRCRTFSHHGDAKKWRDEMRRRKQMVGLPVSGSEMTLTEFTKEWARAKMPDLSANTVRIYTYVLNRFILPELGGYKLMELRPRLIEQWKQDLLAANTGKRTVQQSLGLLSSICKSATAQELMLSNPCLVIDGPRLPRKSIVPLSPSEVEGLRTHMIERGHIGGATLVSVLAYAGLRPSEAYALYWSDVSDGAISVTKKVVEGRILPYTKTQVPRAVTICQPLASDLRELYMARGEPDPDQLVFPRKDGHTMTRTDIGNFRRRIFLPARKAIGREDAGPYHLRHSYASMRIAEGANPAVVAGECGHSVATLLKTYTHLYQGDQNGLPIADQIQAARDSATNIQQEVKKGAKTR